MATGLFWQPLATVFFGSKPVICLALPRRMKQTSESFGIWLQTGRPKTSYTSFSARYSLQTSSMRFFSVFWILLAMAHINAEAASPQYSITDLGTLGGAGSSAVGINKLGQVAGSATTTNGLMHAFLYSGGKMLDLGVLGGNSSSAGGINNLGQVVGSFTSNSVEHAFLYDGTNMIDLDTTNSPYSVAYGINDNGQVVGAMVQGSYNQAVLFDGGTVTGLGTLGGAASHAYGINNNGQIVGSADTNGFYMHPFLFTGGVMTDLGGFGPEGEAFGINNQGQVVGYCYTSEGSYDTFDSFLYSSGTMLDLGFPGSTRSQAYAINENGGAVGLVYTSSNTFAFLYSGGTLQNLNDLIAPSNWNLLDAKGINDSGQIVGQGYNPSGQVHAYVLSPLTTPPLLHVEYHSGLFISWPTNFTGCALYQSPAAVPGNWIPVTNTPTIINGQYQVSISVLTAGQQFFRLICH